MKKSLAYCKYTHAQTVSMLSNIINRAQYVRAIEMIKHKYMVMNNHKICIIIILCSLNTTAVELRFQTRRAIGQ